MKDSGEATFRQRPEGRERSEPQTYLNEEGNLEQARTLEL